MQLQFFVPGTVRGGVALYLDVVLDGVSDLAEAVAHHDEQDPERPDHGREEHALPEEAVHPPRLRHQLKRAPNKTSYGELCVRCTAGKTPPQLQCQQISDSLEI